MSPPPITTQRVEVQAAKTAIVMVLLVAGFRLTGKRETSQLNVYDLAMLMALANAVQNAMTAGLGNLSVGVAASLVLVAGAWLLSLVLRRAPRLEAKVIGHPTLLVRDGVVLIQRMRRMLVTRDDLDAACREHGLERTDDVALAVLEVDGSISIVPKGATVLVGDAPKRRRRRRHRG